VKDKLFVKVFVVLCILLMMFVIVNLDAKASTTSQTLSVWQSDWTWVQPGAVARFDHNTGQIPASLEVMIALGGRATVATKPTTVVPYDSYTNGCAEVEGVTPQYLLFHNGCGEALYIQASIITYVP